MFADNPAAKTGSLDISDHTVCYTKKQIKDQLASYRTQALGRGIARVREPGYEAKDQPIDLHEL